MNPLEVTGVGLASSLGGAVTAAAAFRAGLTRVSASDSQAVDLADGETVPIIIQPAQPVSEGFEHHGRWLRLVEVALADLQTDRERSGRSWTSCWRESALIVVLPTADPARFALEDPPPYEDAQRWFLQPLLARLPGVPAVSMVLAVGAIGVAQGLGRIAELIDAGTARRGVLVAVDSLCDRVSVEWLVATGRLKLPGHPLGLQPGEAAAALVVEPAQSGVGSSGVIISGAVMETHAGTSATPFEVARAWRRCLERVVPLADRPVDCYVDLNGEEDRALAWGHLQVLINNRQIVHGHAWLPCGGFGDTGAAGGALACVLAVRAQARGYAHSPWALVWTSAEAGQVGLIALRNADAAPSPSPFN